jgi:hypothetical protein
MRTVCSAHDWRTAEYVVAGEGVCIACDANVRCPLCGDKRYGRVPVDTPLFSQGLTCEVPACGHAWPFTTENFDDETSRMAWNMAFASWLQCVPPRAKLAMSLPYRFHEPRNYTDAQHDRHGALVNRADTLMVRDLEAVARTLPHFGMPGDAEMFECSVIESLDTATPDQIPAGVTFDELLDTLELWLISRGA